MKYLEFRKALKVFPVFSINDINKVFKDFDNRRLSEWQKKGYILKVRRGYYCFADYVEKEGFLQFASNKIYSPSYISLESALAHYGLIPEESFLLTSVSSRNTAEFQTQLGSFSYRHLKSDLFFGYKVLTINNLFYKIGEVEKVILDYLYLNKLDSIEQMKAMRFNAYQVDELVDFGLLSEYQELFKSKTLDKRVKKLIKAIND
jgi:predicted transcriptional regulator of viral defense system